MDGAEVIEVIERAFEQVPHPGDAFLLGSRDGGEPLEEVGAFHGLTDWHTPTPEFLDAHYTVLSFLSEGSPDLRRYLDEQAEYVDALIRQQRDAP